ncbi:MAG: hypothetical protein IPI46_02105 [Bacteroidetes bacterium]|nr:hypothetical protein [Bacteroidota bacterium]
MNTSSKTTLQTSTALNDESTNHTKQKSSNSSTSNKSLAVVTKSKKSNKSTQIKKTAFTSTSTEAPSDYKTHQSKLEIEPTLQTRKSNDGMQHRTAIDTNHYTVIRKNDGVIRNPRYVAGLENYIPVQLDSVTVIRYQAPKAAIDLHPTSQVLNHDSAQKMFEKHAFELYFLGGMYMNKAFKGNVDNPQAWAFSPYVGIGIEKQFTRKLTMATHIGFTYFNGLNSQLSVKNYQYGFGLDSTTTTVTHKKLFQLYLPIHVYYEWMKHHAILFGLGVSYQPEVYSKVSTTEMTNNVGFAGNSTKQISTQSTHEYGYRGGFNSMDVFAQIGYSYQIWNGLMLQAAYQQGFMDNTKNNYFKNSLNNTQTRISIGLKYNFKRL